MVENASRTNLSCRRDSDIEEEYIDDMSLKTDPECYDDDGHVKRTGNIWTTSSHIITAVIGSGVLSLAWSIAQMGWIAGPAVMLLFSVVTLCTSSYLADCYRTGNPKFGKRNYTFMEAVQNILETGTFKGSLTGISIGTVTEAQKVCGVFQALGNIAFAYAYSQVLIEIQDTIKSPPSEVKTMKTSAKISIGVTTTFYMLCGCTGYAAFGDLSPGNLLTGFDNFSAFWLIDTANVALVVHLMGAYQVYANLSLLSSSKRQKKWCKIDKKFKISIPGLQPYNLNIFIVVWRTVFDIITTFIAMLIPFFNVLNVYRLLNNKEHTLY